MLAAFYGAVLPATGPYALFLAPTKRHVWCDSLAELTQETQNRINSQGVYFATSSFHEATSRTAANSSLRRSFCFDIDAGAEKFEKHGEQVYPTQREAVKALVSWCQSNALPASYVVSSGAGLHVYFCLDTDITVESWKPVAEALKQAALQQGLRIDPTVTADAARILRPLGTPHHTGLIVKSLLNTACTYSLAQISAVVSKYVKLPPAPRRASINDEVLQAAPQMPRSILRIASRCAAVGHATGLAGDVSEPYWRGLLGIIKHCVEGEAAAHQFSQGSPDYDYDTTQAKFDRWNAGPTTCDQFTAENPTACSTCPHKGKIRSPIALGAVTQAELPAPAPAPVPTASAERQPFASDDEDDTEGAAEGILAGEPEFADPGPKPWDGYLPTGYTVGKMAGRYVMFGEASKKAADGAMEPYQLHFSTTVFWFEACAPSTEGRGDAAAVYGVYNSKTKVVSRQTLLFSRLARADTLLTDLAGTGVLNMTSNLTEKKLMDDFVRASLFRIQNTGQRQRINDRFGTMHDDNGNITVAQGAFLIHKDGTVTEGVVAEKLRSRAAAYRPCLPPGSGSKWEATVWEEYVEPRAKRHIAYLDQFYSDDNFRPYQLAIMLSWGSPMMAFMQGQFHPGTPLPGVGLTVSLYSPKSGIGKTSAMHAAAMAFGAPTGICLQLDQNNSTDNARQGLVLQSGTMPCFMDEMEDVSALSLASLVSSVGNGASKVRMTKDISIGPVQTTALINVMSTNKSHRELVVAARAESAAVQMRLLEIECSYIQPVSQERSVEETKARSELVDCYGAIGAMLHLAMCTLGSDKLNKIGMYYADIARSHVGGGQDGRLLWRALGACLAVRHILRSLDLVVFEDSDIISEFRRWHDAGYDFAQANIISSDGKELMRTIITDLHPKTLITINETMRYFNAPDRVDVMLNDRMPEPVLARSVQSGRYTYIAVSALKEWCQRKGVGFANLMTRCTAADVFEIPEGTKTPIRLMSLYKGLKVDQTVRTPVVKVLLDNIDSGESVGTGANVVNLRNPPKPDDQTPSSSASA
jgi:hypothetical protein